MRENERGKGEPIYKLLHAQAPVDFDLNYTPSSYFVWCSLTRNSEDFFFTIYGLIWVADVCVTIKHFIKSKIDILMLNCY